MKMYHHGMDVLGEGPLDTIATFVPWLGVVNKVAETQGVSVPGTEKKLSGAATAVTPTAVPDTKAAVQQALEAERQKQALAKAEAEVKKSKMLLYGTITTLGVGGVIFLLMRR